MEDVVKVHWLSFPLTLSRPCILILDQIDHREDTIVVQLYVRLRTGMGLNSIQEIIKEYNS